MNGSDLEQPVKKASPSSKGVMSAVILVFAQPFCGSLTKAKQYPSVETCPCACYVSLDRLVHELKKLHRGRCT